MLTKKELGQLIKDARKIKTKKIGKNYTQKMLAADIERSQSYIGDIESGRTYPSIVILTQICKACEVDLSFFQVNKKLDSDIDKFIKLQLPGIDNENLSEMKKSIIKDPETKIDYIYDSLRKDSNLYLNNLFTSPEEVITFLLHNPSIINFCGIDVTKLDKLESDNFIKDLLYQLKLISYKYKK